MSLYQMPKRINPRHFPVELIQFAAETGPLCEGFATGEIDDLALLLSIDKYGIRDPLVLTIDHMLLSGRRRLSAARVLEFAKVPVRIVGVEFRKLPPEQRVAILKGLNRPQDEIAAERFAKSVPRRRSNLVSLKCESRAYIPTDEAAAHLNRASKTLRMWACFDTGPLRPFRVHGRLQWPVDEIKMILGVA